MKAICAVVGMVVLSGCATTFDLVGGPRRERSSLSARGVLDEMEPKVRESASARDALSSVRTRSRVGNVLVYSGLGMLVPCIGVPAISSKFNEVSAAVMITSCSTTIALELIALFVLPKLGDYGNILRAFNSDFPATPFSSTALGVSEPPRVAAP